MTKNEEEVWRRRGKTSRSRLNAYQKAVIVAGVLSLFLAIGLRPGMAPILPAGVAGGALLLLLLLKDPKPPKGERQKADPVESLPPLEEKAVEQPEPVIDPKGKEVFISQETVPSDINELQQGLPYKDEPEKRFEEENPEEKEFLKDPQVLPENGGWSEIRERVVFLEEKTINLEEMLMQLEERVVNIQENYLKSEPKIDLQTILTNIEERAEKIA